MNNLINLLSIAGTEKTLIIASGEYGLHKRMVFNDRIFLYVLSESMLHKHDPLEKGWIQHYVEQKECKQVVIIGSVNQQLIDRLIRNESLSSPAASLKFNMKVFLRNQDKEILRQNVRDRMLMELHVISQCNLLMDYYFIRNLCTNERIQIRGFVKEPSALQLKEIFYNGTVYNDIISMN